MVVAPPRLTRQPWWTLGLLAAALVAQWSPYAADLAVYDRAGIASGELWRIVTGHLVHFSGAHLFNNLIVLLPAVWTVETRYRRDFGPLLMGAAVGIGIALLVGEPQILHFGGASGISLAFLVYACLRGLHEHNRRKVVCMLLLVVVCAKFAAELSGWQFRDWQAEEGFVPVILSHVVGATTGVLVYLWWAFGQLEFSRAAKDHP